MNGGDIVEMEGDAEVLMMDEEIGERDKGWGGLRAPGELEHLCGRQVQTPWGKLCAEPFW